MECKPLYHIHNVLSGRSWRRWSGGFTIIDHDTLTLYSQMKNRTPAVRTLVWRCHRCMSISRESLRDILPARFLRCVHGGG